MTKWGKNRLCWAKRDNVFSVVLVLIVLFWTYVTNKSMTHKSPYHRAFWTALYSMLQTCALQWTKTNEKNTTVQGSEMKSMNNPNEITNNTNYNNTIYETQKCPAWTQQLLN